jgi:ribosomal protein L33
MPLVTAPLSGLEKKLAATNCGPLFTCAQQNNYTTDVNGASSWMKVSTKK